MSKKERSFKEINILIGNKLRSRRTVLGLSQGLLGKRIGITFQQIQKYEKGHNAMNALRLCQFAQKLKVPVSYFFEDIEVAKDEAPKNFAPSDRETLELVKAFSRISEPTIRKRIADLLRAIATPEWLDTSETSNPYLSQKSNNRGIL